MSDYTLHCFLESGNAYKTALMLQLSGADWRPHFVDFMNGAHKSQEYRALNEMGEVPALVDHTEDDLVLTQSGLILYHLSERFPQYAPKTKEDEREVMRWILFDNHKMTGNLSAYRFMSHFMKLENAATEFTGGRMVQALKVLDRRLDGRDWVAADHCTIADISLCGYLYWPEHSGLDWNDYQNIGSWLERIASLPNYAPPEDILPSAAQSKTTN